MITSKVTLWNLAVTRLGHEQISEEEETTKAGRLCRLHWPIVRDSVLRSHPWNFAIRRATLARLSATPNHEFTYAYALPTDPYCLKVIRTSFEADGYSSTAVYGYPGLVGYGALPIEYRIESIDVSGSPVRSILCNETSMKIEYIARIEDVAQYDDLFVDAVSAKMAAELAIPLTDNQAAAKTMMELYQMKMAEARVNDAQEGSPRDVVNTDGWLIARL